MNRLMSVGITVVGYVYTDYGARSASSVRADIAKFKSLYGVNGIFLDQMPTRSDTSPTTLADELCEVSGTGDGRRQPRHLRAHLIRRHGRHPGDLRAVRPADDLQAQLVLNGPEREMTSLSYRTASHLRASRRWGHHPLRPLRLPDQHGLAPPVLVRALILHHDRSRLGRDPLRRRVHTHRRDSA